MFKIGDFSKLAKTTVKTLRYYEEVGLLNPAEVDEWTGYRYYSTDQLYPLHEITSLRQAGLSIDEIIKYQKSENKQAILLNRRHMLELEQVKTVNCLSNLDALLNTEKEKTKMKYTAVITQLPEYTVYYKEGTVKDFSEIVPFILRSGEECLKANPDIKCVEPDYCYVSYLDPEFKPENMRIEYAQAVTKAGKDTDTIKFKVLPSIKAVSVYHKGDYVNLTEAYAYALKWVKDNGYQMAGIPRERYIDGIWNKEDKDEWLTEIQIPIVDYSKEVKEKWEDTTAYKENTLKKVNQTSGEELESVREAEEIFKAFADIRNTSYSSQEAQLLVKRWQDHITKFYYTCTKEILAGLALMYVADERFKNNLDSHGEGTAKFMSDAITFYCK